MTKTLEIVWTNEIRAFASQRFLALSPLGTTVLEPRYHPWVFEMNGGESANALTRLAHVLRLGRGASPVLRA